MSVHETARPIHLTERDCWLSECACGWEQVTRTEIEARLAWKNHKSAMDELEERIAREGGVLRLSTDARDPDVASIEEAFLYIAPVHESVVRDARGALRRIVEEIDKWHREALDWQQAKSDADAAWEEAHQLAHRQGETIFDLTEQIAMLRKAVQSGLVFADACESWPSTPTERQDYEQTVESMRRALEFQRTLRASEA